MKVAILAGGKGTRLAEETSVRPKPMVEIGSRPILWHIMMHYWKHGFEDFVIALGFKGEHIKKYMVDYCALQGHLTVNIGSNGQRNVAQHAHYHPNWSIDLIETGMETLTAGRIRKLRPFLDEKTFMLTYGDGVSDVDINKLVAFHKAHGRLATMTAVRPPARYGHLLFNGDQVTKFEEKPQTAEGWINGGFFVLEPEAIDFIEGDGEDMMWENKPMHRLAEAGQLMAYRHEGFWSCMDTLRDKLRLQDMWDRKERPWATWEQHVKPGLVGTHSDEHRWIAV